MFVKFILIKDGKEAPMEIHITKAGKYAHSLERQGVKFRLDGVVKTDQPVSGNK